MVKKRRLYEVYRKSICMGHVSSQRGLYSLVASEPILLLETTSCYMAATLCFSVVSSFERIVLFSSLRYDKVSNF